MKQIFSLCIFVFIVNSISAQVDSLKNLPIFYKNAVYLSAGTMIVFPAFSGQYEYVLAERNRKTHIATFLRAGYGSVNSNSLTDIKYLQAEFGIITGAKKTHFEAALGVDYFMLKSEDDYVWPECSIGLRIQKPRGKVIFRTGTGFPETLYIGLGISF